MQYLGKLLALFVLTFIAFTIPVVGQQKVAVFLDCDRCDDDFIRREISFVDYVRDRTLSDVHLLIGTQRSGSGREYELVFLGRNDFEGVSDTLSYATSNTDTDNEEREGLARYIGLGLVRYVAKTDHANLLDLRYDAPETASIESPVDDKWNYWVFRVGSNGQYRGEESRKTIRLRGNVSANRTTEDWKIRMFAFGSYSEQRFNVDDTTITSVFRRGDVRTQVVKSITRHWSAGTFASLNTSSFDNTKLGVSLSPAIEYSFFPYSESSKRELRFTYFINFDANDYDEPTIFNKTKEYLVGHNFVMDLELEQPWGEADAFFEVSNFITNFEESKLDLYNIELGGSLEFRVVRGFSVFVSSSVSRVKDQITLPLAEASDEDILLGNVRLATSFEYEAELGFSYTFGSIYNSIVNSRFGS